MVCAVGSDEVPVLIGEVVVTVENAPPPSPDSAIPVRMPEPTVEEVISAAEQRSIKIAERGTGYVIFDLRSPSDSLR